MLLVVVVYLLWDQVGCGMMVEGEKQGGGGSTIRICTKKSTMVLSPAKVLPQWGEKGSRYL